MGSVKYYPTHISDVWNQRTEADSGHCPLCGGEVEFDGLMNYSTLFADAYCPTCRVRWEFQRVSRTRPRDETDAIERARRKDVEKARKAFGRRE